MRISDWSSYVCSSDLRNAQAVHLRRVSGLDRRGLQVLPGRGCGQAGLLEDVRAVEEQTRRDSDREDRKSVVSGKNVSVSVDLGGARIIKKNNTTNKKHLFILYLTSIHTTNNAQ